MLFLVGELLDLDLQEDDHEFEVLQVLLRGLRLGLWTREHVCEVRSVALGPDGKQFDTVIKVTGLKWQRFRRHDFLQWAAEVQLDRGSVFFDDGQTASGGTGTVSPSAELFPQEPLCTCCGNHDACECGKHVGAMGVAQPRT